MVLTYILAALLAGQETPGPEDLAGLLKIVKPQAGESPWREIPWLTSVREARERAVAEGKPIVVFTAADGSPLSRT